MFYKGWFVSSSVSRPSLQSFLWIVLYLFFSPSFTNLHLISRLSPLFPPLALLLILRAISPECLCFVSQLQAERFIAAICSLYFSPSLPLSIRPSLRLTQAFYIYSSGSVRLSLRRLFPDLNVSFLWHYSSAPHVAWQSFFFFISLLGAFSSQRRHALWHDGLNNLWIEEEMSVIGRWRWDVWHPSRGQRAKSVLWCVWRWRNLHSPPGDRWQVTGEGRQGLWVD